MKTNLLDRVIFGLIGIGSINSNYQGSFNGGLPLEHNGLYVAHDTALKYMFKREQQIRGEKVFGLKTTYIDDKGKTKARDYKKALEFHGINEKAKDAEQLQKLFEFKDVRNFGQAVPFAIQGVVQMNTGINAYDYTELCEEKILSPFASSEDKSQATNGTKAYLDEAHFIHDFVVCPNNIKIYKELGIEGVGEYTQEDYEDFKDVITCCATNYRSKAKEGCNNEFALFVEMKDELHGNMIGTLNRFVKAIKEDDITIIDLSKVAKQLEKIKEHIDNIEIQYDPYVTKINFPINFENVKYKDIVSKELI